VDGQIIAGQALIDQHQLTGEAQPAAKEEGDWVLAFVITAADNGRKFNLAKTYDISREQYAQAAYDEQNTATARLQKNSRKANRVSATVGHNAPCCEADSVQGVHYITATRPNRGLRKEA
jgi:hypothetical protein